MFLLRQIFNWFKLFVALDVMVVAIILPLTELQEFKNGPDRWGPLLGVSGIFFLIGLLLFIWFLRILKKHRREKVAKNPGNQHAVESHFYLLNPAFCEFMEGWSFNGFGTKLLTWSNRSEDGSVVVTKWIILGFFPAFPLYRQRIRVVAEKDKIHVPGVVSSSRLTYEPFERVPLSKKLIRYTYAFYFLCFLPAIFLPLVFILIYLPQLNAWLPGGKFWLILLAYLGWGIFWMFLTDVFNKRLFLNRHV